MVHMQKKDLNKSKLNDASWIVIWKHFSGEVADF